MVPVGDNRISMPATPSVVGAVKRILSNHEWQPLEFEAWRAVRTWSRQAAAVPVNRNEAVEAFARFYAERRRVPA